MAVYLGQDLVEQNGGQPVNSTIVNETITVDPCGQQLEIIPDQGYTGIGRIYMNPVVLTPISARPDSIVKKSWSYDKYIVADEGVALPTTYSTSDVVLKDTYYLDTVDVDFDNNDYILSARILVIPEYTTDVIDAGRQDYFFYTNVSEYTKIPANAFKKYAIDDYYRNYIGTNSTANNYRLFYFTGSSATGAALTTLYGVRGVYNSSYWSANSGDSYIRPSAPALKLTGHSTYLNQTYYEALEDIRFQFVIDLIETPRGKYNIDGIGLYHGNLRIIDDIENNNWTLT